MNRCGLGQSHLRVARPSGDLAAVVRFYRDGLEFEVLSEFRDRDGCRIVLQNAAWNS